MNVPPTQGPSIVTLADAQRIQAAFMAAAEGPRAGTCRINYATTSMFLRYLGDTPPASTDRLILNADRLMQWMIHDCRGRAVPYAVCRLGILKRYLQALHRAGLTATNLLEDFRTAHRQSPWHILVAALQSQDPAAALKALESPPASLAGPLHQHVQQYLEAHEAMGKEYGSQRQALNDLDRHLCAWGVNSLQAVDAGMIHRWVDTLTCNPRTRRHKTRYART